MDVGRGLLWPFVGREVLATSVSYICQMKGKHKSCIGYSLLYQLGLFLSGTRFKKKNHSALVVLFSYKYFFLCCTWLPNFKALDIGLYE